ncbi:T9SS type A sorting domain-containing protein [Emticicia sp. BO119]|uniref:T9SS type A sorting domain-containing protein n=1 Tax=Emticicia sp. BO119 TaxID=2757768 RepID=UPI0015F0D5A7|nr:T9SS type A sorting domain-containing protein [Emticicia sp. BO119]MBA4852869.1 T9SS type A sorting domain-containing protein [Emticicia sp. BO119]
MRLKQIFSLAIFLVLLKPAMAQWKLNDTNPVVLCDAINFQDAMLYATDEEANSYYIWTDYRTDMLEIYVQKFNSRGVAQWQKNGVRIGRVLDKYAVIYSQRVIRPDGEGGAFIGWHLLPDVNNQSRRLFYAQHISRDGNLLWGDEGLKVTDRELVTLQPYDDIFDIVDLKNNQLLVFFNQYDNNVGVNTVFTKKLDYTGKTIEEEKILYVNNRIEDKVIYDTKNSRFLTLQKHNQFDYVFQTFNADNTPIIATPKVIYQNPFLGNSRIDLFKVDNEGNAVIGRTLSIDDGRKFVIANKVDTEGNPLWGANGVNMGSDHTFDIQIVPTTDGGGIATWLETANPQQPFLIAKLTASGNILWKNEVFAPRSNKPYLLPNKLESDGKDGVYTLWLQPKEVGYDLTVQHFDNNGSKRFGNDGIAFKDYTFYGGARLIPYPKGGVIVLWGANKEQGDGIGYTVDLYTNYIGETGRFGLEDLPTIEIPPVQPDKFCAGQTFTVRFLRGGPAFNLDNTFKVLLSDKDGNFTNATQIGQDSRTTINVVTPQNLENGTYRIKVVSTSPATESVNYIVVQIDEAGAPIITADKMSACLGETFKLTGSGCEAGIIKWSNNQEGTAISVTLDNSTTFTAACNIQGCKNSVASNEVSLQVNKATATANNSGPYYTNESIKLSSSGGVKYAWTGPASFVSTEQNPTISNATLSMGGIYRVVVTDINNCTASAETTVLINNLLGVEREINIRTFPNPTSHEVIVEFFAQANNPVSISLIDMKGSVAGERKLKATGGYQQEVVDIRYFARGQYLIKVNTSQREVVKKIIIEK